jgi:hypothetical protein
MTYRKYRAGLPGWGVMYFTLSENLMTAARRQKTKFATPLERRRPGAGGFFGFT